MLRAENILLAPVPCLVLRHVPRIEARVHLNELEKANGGRHHVHRVVAHHRANGFSLGEVLRRSNAANKVTHIEQAVVIPP